MDLSPDFKILLNVHSLHPSSSNPHYLDMHLPLSYFQITNARDLTVDLQVLIFIFSLQKHVITLLIK